ncbi:MAG: hypothetical protein KZQ93_18950 [Candidatus Thiodiazotropha sp. (ex Monitilora ramsayi)]|nr:hypothetical protein [Candidatus Thiodiazotropha sp. (ex Monitilora ramsayi)]
MKYLRTTLATDWDEEKSLSERVLETVLFFVPKANPGYENKMHLVKEWMVEFDEENKPFREIALDNKGHPVFSGPSEESYGFWLDTDMTYPDFEGSEVQSYEFEKLWVKSGVQVIT